MKNVLVYRSDVEFGEVVLRGLEFSEFRLEGGSKGHLQMDISAYFPFFVKFHIEPNLSIITSLQFVQATT